MYKEKSLDTIYYFGHHKCASQYIKAVLIQTAQHLGMSIGWAKSSEQSPIDSSEYHQSMAKIGGAQRDILGYSNANRAILEAVSEEQPYRGFHVIRDPRDIMVSDYFSNLYSHPIFPDNAQRLQRIRQQIAAAPGQEEGLLLELELCRWNFANLAGWDYTNPQVYETCFERLTADPLAEFTTIFEFLGIPVPSLDLGGLGAMSWYWLRHRWQGKTPPRRERLPRQALQWILWRNSFERKSGGRRKGEEDVRHHYRKGIPGDWRNYFTPRVKESFRQRYGDLLIQLGYETSLDW